MGMRFLSGAENAKSGYGDGYSTLSTLNIIELHH